MTTMTILFVIFVVCCWGVLATIGTDEPSVVYLDENQARHG